MFIEALNDTMSQ